MDHVDLLLIGQPPALRPAEPWPVDRNQVQPGQFGDDRVEILVGTGLTVNHHDRHTLSGLLEVVNLLAVQADVLTVRWRHCRQSGDR